MLPIDIIVVARTKISEDVKHTFAWTIERFSERQEPNSQFLWSSKFTIRGPDEQVQFALNFKSSQKEARMSRFNSL